MVQLLLLIPSCNVESCEVTDGRSLRDRMLGNDVSIASVFDIAGHMSCWLSRTLYRKVPAELGKVIWKNIRVVGSGGTKNFLPRTIKFLSRIKDNYDFEALNTLF